MMNDELLDNQLVMKIILISEDSKNGLFVSVIRIRNEGILRNQGHSISDCGLWISKCVDYQ
jgi:hypothetical protein